MKIIIYINGKKDDFENLLIFGAMSTHDLIVI